MYSQNAIGSAGIVKFFVYKTLFVLLYHIAALVLYSDTSANEGNSFRNHIR